MRLFQFHKGTIKTNDLDELAFDDKYFNSIKVRLKHVLILKNKHKGAEFQFHKGTIKT